LLSHHRGFLLLGLVSKGVEVIQTTLSLGFVDGLLNGRILKSILFNYLFNGTIVHA